MELKPAGIAATPAGHEKGLIQTHLSDKVAFYVQTAFYRQFPVWTVLTRYQINFATIGCSRTVCRLNCHDLNFAFGFE